MTKKWLLFLILVSIAAVLLQACQPETVEESPAAEEQPTAQEEAVPTETAASGNDEAPATGAGGNLVMVNLEPDTLDPHKTYSGAAFTIMSYIGSSLIYISETGEYCPYLAESWNSSEDALTWTFNLRQDVTFHDGTPLTAQDYAWTYNRALDPETASPVTPSLLGNVESIQAVDDHTLEIKLVSPNFPLLYGLTAIGYVQPLPQRTFESMGADAFARSPVGVGPFKFVEWVTGDHITLARNPDFNWAPVCVEAERAPSIESLEFRFLPEYAIILAGMEAGEVDYASIEARDQQRILDTGNFNVFEWPIQGIYPYLILNNEKPPFNDIRVRQAVNMGVDRESIIEIGYQGGAVPQYGPISATVMGYWPDVEEIGYSYNPEEAKSLLAEAGYTLNASGVMEKDGVLLQLDLLSISGDEGFLRVSQLVQEQLKNIGIELNIVQYESNSLWSVVEAGDFTISIGATGYGEADLMFFMFHSSNIGVMNFSRTVNPELDTLLERSRSETDPAIRQEVVNNIQRIIVEQAYIVPLITPVNKFALNSRVAGASFNRFMAYLELFNATITE